MDDSEERDGDATTGNADADGLDDVARDPTRDRSSGGRQERGTGPDHASADARQNAPEFCQVGSANLEERENRDVMGATRIAHAHNTELLCLHDSGTSLEVPIKSSGGSIVSIEIGSDGSLGLTNDGEILRRSSF